MNKKRLGRLQPLALADARWGLRYGRDHQLSSPAREWPRLFQDARRFGLHLLPTDHRLDGLVLDVGANIGDFAATIRSLEPRARVVCFEPVPDAAAHLRSRFTADTSVTIEECAVSDTAGTATLSVSDNSVFSSLLPMRSEMGEVYDPEQLVVTKQAEVATVRLDDVITEPVTLLKIDVQGHEIAAFEGARHMLAQTHAVLAEVTFVSHYEGDSSFFQIHEFLSDCGFDLVALGEGRHHAGRLMWVDACYARL